MSSMKIEVVPDASTPAGGHAIIRLRGIGLLPPGSTFRIDPIDDMEGGPQSGWPSGELRPLETRQIADGVEFRVGPEVVDSPRLEPGTPVTISLPGSSLSGELVWPDLPVSSGAAVAAVVMSPSQMASELAAAERARLEVAAHPALKPTTAASPVLSSPSPVKASEYEFEAPPAESQPESQPSAPAAGEFDAGRVLHIPDPALAASANASTGRVAPSLPPLYAQNSTQKSSQNSTQDSQPSAERSRPYDKSLSRLAKSVATGPGDQAADAGLPTVLLKRTGDDKGGSIGISRGELRPGTIEGRVSPPQQPSRVMPFLAGASAAGLAAAAIIAVLMVRQTHAPIGMPGATGAGPTVAAGTKTGLADVFTAGYQSPRGEIATDVDLPTALRLADYNLHGIDRPVDRAEAEFWLKKAMSLTAGHSQLRWAMTQLGTLQAEPVTGTPDYEKARMLWEIAGANGDPIALCFLGTLAEFGLGAAADRTKALEYFKQSKDFGGCPNADEAIARLSK